MLDLVNSQLEHTIDLSSWAVDLAGSARAKAACASGAGRRKRTTPPSCHAVCLSRVLESVDIGLSRAAFVLLTLFLSSMKHHQVLCVLSACCPCLVCMLSKVYLARVPFEARNP